MNRFWQVVVAFLLLIAVSAWPDASGTVETTRFVVQTHEDAAAWRLIHVTRKRDGSQFTIRRLAIGSISHAFEAPNKLAVVFSIKSERDNEILILNTEDAAVEKEVRCFAYAASPIGAFVAYERDQPRFGPREQKRPAVMIMNLARESPYEEFLYPRSEEGTRTPNGKVNGPISPFLWREDGKQVLYFNKLSEYGSWEDWQLELIVATRNEQDDEWSVSVKRLDKMTFMKEGTPPEKARLLIGEMEWVSHDEFKATQHEVMGISNLKAPAFTMSVDGVLSGFSDHSAE